MTAPGKQLNVFTKALRGLVKKAGDEKVMNALGEEAVKIIVRRTRLGKTARRTTRIDELGKIKNSVQRLKTHSPGYRRFRRDYRDHLSALTRWNRSNLTLSGQLLASIGVRRSGNGFVIIGADRKRHKDFLTGETSQLTNIGLAAIVTEQGRPFLELSTLDDKKLTRFYRRQFGDLRKRFGKPLK